MFQTLIFHRSPSPLFQIYFCVLLYYHTFLFTFFIYTYNHYEKELSNMFDHHFEIIWTKWMVERHIDFCRFEHCFRNTDKQPVFSCYIYMLSSASKLNSSFYKKSCLRKTLKMFTERKSYTNEFFHKILSLFTFLGNRIKCSKYNRRTFLLSSSNCIRCCCLVFLGWVSLYCLISF